MIIDRTAYEAMIAHLRQAVPLEGVGLLAGPAKAQCPDDTDGDGNCGRRLCPRCGGDGRTCDRWVPLDNVAEFPRVRYEVDPAALLDAYQALEDEGRWPWIMVHSHVTGGAVPSPTDIRYATDERLHHLVVSLGGREPFARLWRIAPDAPGDRGLTRVLFEVSDLGFRTAENQDLTHGVTGA